MKEIELRNGGKAIVDDSDYPWLIQYKWYKSPYGYATRHFRHKGRQYTGYMHRLILQAPPRRVTDHINHDKLDNRRCNLRLCTQRENSANGHKRGKHPTSRYKGVYFSHKNRNWCAMITHDGRGHHLGTFDSEEGAARQYDAAARAIYSNYALLNFPDDIAAPLDINAFTTPRKARASSKYRGVTYNARHKKWYATIKAQGQHYYLGCFNSELEAARAYNAAAMDRHGTKARLNLL